MSQSPLDNLVKIGQLVREPCNESELNGLIKSGLLRLEDAERKANSLDGRFDLA